jgi:hypothetical protein
MMTDRRGRTWPYVFSSDRRKKVECYHPQGSKRLTSIPRPTDRSTLDMPGNTRMKHRSASYPQFPA